MHVFFASSSHDVNVGFVDEFEGAGSTCHAMNPTDSFAANYEAMLCADAVAILFEDEDRAMVQTLGALMGAALGMGRPLYVLMPRYWSLMERILGVEYFDDIDRLMGELVARIAEEELQENQ